MGVMVGGAGVEVSVGATSGPAVAEGTGSAGGEVNVDSPKLASPNTATITHIIQYELTAAMVPMEKKAAISAATTEFLCPILSVTMPPAKPPATIPKPITMEKNPALERLI